MVLALGELAVSVEETFNKKYVMLKLSLKVLVGLYWEGKGKTSPGRKKHFLFLNLENESESLSGFSEQHRIWT